MDKIIKFLDSPTINNQWIYIGPIEVYVRKSRRFINGELVPTFDLASIEVQASKRGKGYFKRFLENLTNLLNVHYPGRFQYLYVECVLEPRLTVFLPSIGFVKNPAYEDPPSFYKLL